jgi:hypothetical protein
MLSVSVELASKFVTESATPMGGSGPYDVSADDRYVVFGSSAPNVVSGVNVPAGVSNIYRHDRETGETVLVSVDSEGTGGANGTCYSAQISDDGDTVVFVSAATNLNPLDQDTKYDIIARRISTQETFLVSINKYGTGGAGFDCFDFDISGSGDDVAFSTQSNVIHALDTTTQPDVFVRRISSGSTVLVSIGGSGTASGGVRPQISKDGSIVGFVGGTTILQPLDANFRSGIYQRNLLTATTQLISVNSDSSTVGNGDSSEFDMSDDGKVVAFSSSATNLDSRDSNSSIDIYVHDTSTGVTELASFDTTGLGGANRDCSKPTLSGDGTVVAFLSEATNLHSLDRMPSIDLYARKLSSQSTSLVTVTHDNNKAANSDLSMNGFNISNDGRLIAFTSDAPGLSPLDMDREYDQNRRDAFVRDLWTNETSLISVNSSGTANGSDVSGGCTISASGLVVAFSSRASNLVEGDDDNNGFSDCFVRDLSLATTTLVSTSSSTAPGGSGNGESTFELFGHAMETEPVMSADGRYTVFVSYANNLVSSPSIAYDEYRTNVYRYDRLTGETVLVSVDSAGTDCGNGSSYQPVISADGNVVAFTSGSGNLVAGQLPNAAYAQVYVRYIAEGVTVCASVLPNQYPIGGSMFPALSADGRMVAFESMSKSLSPLDSDSNRDIYVRDLLTGKIDLVSVNATGTGSGNGDAHTPKISADGSTVIYSSESGNLHPLDKTNGWDVFARRLNTNTTELVSMNLAGTRGGNNYSSVSSLSADGNRIAFESGSTDLSPSDTNSATDVYLRDLIAGTTTLVSVNVAGNGGANGEYTSNVVISADGTKVAFTSSSSNLHPLATSMKSRLYVRDLSAATTHLVAPVQVSGMLSLSSDGNIVVFVSDGAGLHPLDTNGRRDVYVSNLALGATQLVSWNVSRTASANGHSSRPLVSADGGVVAFYSAANDLVASDLNKQDDVFIATVIWDQPALPGDYNLDSRVDASDYSVWRDALGSSWLTPYSGADGDGDGAVDQDDYLVWKANFGRSLPTGGGGAEIAVGAESLAASAAILEGDYVESVSETPAPNPIAARQADLLSGALFLATPEPPRRPAFEVGRNARSLDDGRTSDAALLAWCRRNQGVVTKSETKPLARANVSAANEVDEVPVDCFDSVFEGIGRLL